MSKISLSIYLIKEGIDDFDNIKEKCELLREYNENKKMYYKSSSVDEPEWLSKFFKFKNEKIKISNARVLLLRRLKTSDNKIRIFGIVFGLGKTFFKEDVIEEQFGLKIVLNSIEKNKIRRISKIDIGKNYKQSSEQLPKENNIFEFGFDANRDLIKYVTGKSQDDMFENSMLTGGDLFNVSVERDVDNIEDFLQYIYSKYISNNYKNDYPWLDNIKYIRNKSMIKELNEEAVNLLNKKEFDKIWIAVPELVKWDKIRCIKISGAKNDEEKTDIDINDFMNSYRNNIIDNFDQIKNKKINVYSNEDDRKLFSWSAHKCLVGNIEHKGKSYSINDGNWYEINKDFKNEIEQEYNKIPISNIQFIDCAKDFKEDDYNEKLKESLKECFHLHKTLIPTSGTGNNIELCDILYDNNLIHIKEGESSSYLSHLFNQASVSCSLLKNPSFRRKVNNKLKEKKIEYVFPENFDTNKYNVILGIINNKDEENGRPKIPFFSKVSISYTYDLVKNTLGYNFYIKHIQRQK